MSPAVGSVPLTYIFIGALNNGTWVMPQLGDGNWLVTDGFGGWEVIDRPLQVSITQFKGSQPLRLQGPIMFDGFSSGTSVEGDILRLENMARVVGDDPAPSVLVVDAAGAVPYDWERTHGIFWVIEDLQWQGALWEGNQRVRAWGQLNLMQFVQDEHIEELTPAKKARKKSKTSTSSKKRSASRKTYTVKSGDTLSKIAARSDVYGSSSRWQEIAKANSIRDPRSLKVGQVLKIP